MSQIILDAEFEEITDDYELNNHQTDLDNKINKMMAYMISYVCVPTLVTILWLWVWKHTFLNECTCSIL